MSDQPQTEQTAKVSRPFDPAEPECFARYINRTDDNVTTLLLATSDHLDSKGEYDQGDTVTLEWDTVKDIVTVAEMLWRHRCNAMPAKGGQEGGTL